MSDRQELIARLRKWANNTDWPSEADVLLAAATALEEAQGVPREPTPAMIAAGLDRHLPQSMSGERLAMLWRAMYDAAPAAPTRDEQDAKRYRRLRDNGVQQSVLKEPILARVLASGTLIEWDKGGDAADASLDAALAEPKR